MALAAPGSTACHHHREHVCGDGELRIRRTATNFEDAFGTLTGTYPAGYLAQLDAEDELR